MTSLKYRNISKEPKAAIINLHAVLFSVIARRWSEQLKNEAAREQTILAILPIMGLIFLALFDNNKIEFWK